MLKYHKIPTHMAMSEKRKLLELASNMSTMDSPNVVEIGSYLGASTCFLARGLESTVRPGIVHAVDTWCNDAMDNIEPEDVFQQFKKNTESFHNIVTLRGKSADVARDFNITIDLIFFDGDHSYEGIKNDWDLWSPKLAPKAVVVFHDWGWADGVRRVILEDIHPRVQMFDCLPNLWWGYMS